jgi:hypothetical protein
MKLLSVCMYLLGLFLLMQHRLLGLIIHMKRVQFKRLVHQVDDSNKLSTTSNNAFI